MHEIYRTHAQAKTKKSIYDTLYRLHQDGVLTMTQNGYQITAEGSQLIHRYFPERDGIWKLIVFDIPERKRKVRNFLRQKLLALGFKKWQNSIWVSPYKLDRQVEKELNELATKYFIRLIKTTEINYTEDLEKLFDKA